MAWIKAALINTGLVLMSICICLLLVETALHFTSLKLKYLYPLEPGGYLRYDPEIGFDITPNFATSTHAFTDLAYPVWSNSMGCFDTEYDGTSPYIYITGDSFTWGFTAFEDKWGKVLQNKLGIRTLTCGVNAFGPRGELIKTRRDLSRLPQPPKLLIVGYFEGNDFGDDHAPSFTAYNGYRVPAVGRCSNEEMAKLSPLEATTTCTIAPPNYSLLQKIKFELSLNSVLYMIAQRNGVQDALKGILKNVIGSKSDLLNTTFSSADIDSEADWQAHEKDLLLFKTLAEQYGTAVLFVLIPDREEVRAANSPKDSSVHERVKAILARAKIPYVDLLPAFRAEERLPDHAFYWPINEHWNTNGNHRAGELVAEFISQNNLIK